MNFIESMICNVDDATAEARQAAKRIERQIQLDNKRLKNEIKILLLGTGDSGKSTIAKQMKIIYMESFSEEERLKWKGIIHFNIISYVKTLTAQMKRFDIQFGNPKFVELIQPFYSLPDTVDACALTPELAIIVQDFWADSGVQEVWKKNDLYQISDSLPYFMKDAKRFSEANYEPNDDDVLNSRVKTTGINEIEFIIEKEYYRMVDVGGQRSERKKWIHCFQDVTAILYVVALSEYNLMLEESETVNRMHESLKLFDDIINNVWFQKTPIILFLNKMDIFDEKIATIPLTVCFPDYSGGNNAGETKKFIESQYLKRNSQPQSYRHIYTHFTCATDTQNIKIVFQAVQHIIINEIINISF